MPPKNRGGRPRKYPTLTTASKADLELRRQRHQRPGPVDFIAYEPLLPVDIPADTLPEIGLRTSLDIRIPRDHHISRSETPRQRPNPLPDPIPLRTERGLEITEDVQKSDNPRKECQIEAAEMLAGLQSSKTPEAENSVLSREGRQISDLPPRSYLSFPFPVDDIIGRDQGSVITADTSNNSVDAAKSYGDRIISPTPPPQSHSCVLPRTPSSSISSLSTRLRAPSIVLPPPPRSIEISVPSISALHAKTFAPLSPDRRSLSTVADTISPKPAERTATKLARQLRRFQGCTHEQHVTADQRHTEHHQHPNVHPECSSLPQISTLLRGTNPGGTPLPDILGSSELMKASDLPGPNYQAAFEGTSPSFPAEKRFATTLCLSQHHVHSPKNRQAQVTFDIDSLCCFPTSLGVARHGIKWFPKMHPSLNLTADIHFSLRVWSYTHRGELSSQNTPLHKIPHYRFGTMIGMESAAILIFFPHLYDESDHESSTYLSINDQQLWYDGILNPCVTQVIGSSNFIQHLPATSTIANVDSTAVGAEAFARKYSSREQIHSHDLQPQYLDPLWARITETIRDNPSFGRFDGATLLINAKNTKLRHMHPHLTDAYRTWQEHWSQVADPQFYNQDRTFIDLGKQTTSEDSALPYDHVPEDHEAEAFLWRKCCLEAYCQTRNAAHSPAKDHPRRTIYPWATMRDVIGQTLFAAPQGPESADGLIYSQFYMLIKTPFDSATTYVFDNSAVENLALDPGYVRSLQQEGGGATFSPTVCEASYVHSKKRAHANLRDNRWKSYGIREEHRISLTMMEDISRQWQQWDATTDNEVDAVDSPLPYYIVPTQEVLGFLYAQINKYCFLFEHVRAHTGTTYSLPETMVMTIALRALRFCYGSNILQRESLLYKDRWEQLGDATITVREGLGMQESMERCGLGWFQPKFNWATWRLAAPHGENILVGNMLMHAEYKRRWKAVKDLRDVFVRFSQAESWYDRHDLSHHPVLQDKWLEYLHMLNLEQFDLDVWKAMLKAHERSPELVPEVAQQQNRFRFCYREMKNLFVVEGIAEGPYTVTGNRIHRGTVMDLLRFLFRWDDQEQRVGWGNKPFRVILQMTFAMLQRRLGDARARLWLNDHLHLVRLTHWILPYPSKKALITSTKTNRNQEIRGRMMWFSVVYRAPETTVTPAHWRPTVPPTLPNILWHAQRRTFPDAPKDPAWTTSALIAACEAEGLPRRGHEDRWILGKISNDGKGFRPVHIGSLSPSLQLLEQIRGKSMDELDEMMMAFSQDLNGQPLPDGTDDQVSDGDIDIDATTGNDNVAEKDYESSSSIATTDSGSLWTPSGGQRKQDAPAATEAPLRVGLRHRHRHRHSPRRSVAGQ